MYRYIKTVLLLVIFSTATYGQSIDEKFFSDTDDFMKRHVKEGRVNYTALMGNMDILPLINTIEQADLSGADEATKKAFYINAYNLHVINLALKEYPIQSVQDITGFFEKKKITVAGNTSSLNAFEKDYMLKPYGDARLHFVLVCGALGCPPITNFAYHPSKLEMQLEQQTTIALNDPSFIKSEGNNTQLSQIFKWYKDDFGGGKRNVINYINQYRDVPVNGDHVSYYSYNWTLNDTKLTMNTGESGQGAAQGNNANRYVVSSTIPKGTYEIKVFNNLYTQKTGSGGNLDFRSSFFTTTVTALYGLNNRLNVGINGRVRKVRNHSLPSSPFGVFGSDENGSSRSGLTGIGPMIRWAAVPQWENFSIQSSFTYAIGDALTGNSEQPFIDWNGAVWNTQFFNDFPIGDNFSLFTEIDYLWEDIGRSNDETTFSNRQTTPITLILSYNPTPMSTLYVLTGYAPTWSIKNEEGDFAISVNDYFYQAGIGGKYQFTPNLELELLYSDFTTKFLKDGDGQAATYNLGLRFNL